jgi:hypothetical protein
MEAIERFSLAPHAGEYASWPLNSALFIDGTATDAFVPGYTIDGQYRTPYGFLLVTSFDCPYEESYAFTLLDDTFRALATAEIGVPYGKYLLHAHWPIHDNAIRLHFHEHLIYTLQVCRPAGFFLPRYKLSLHVESSAPLDTRTLASIHQLDAQLASIRASMSDRSTPVSPVIAGDTDAPSVASRD